MALPILLRSLKQAKAWTLGPSLKPTTIFIKFVFGLEQRAMPTAGSIGLVVPVLRDLKPVAFNDSAGLNRKVFFKLNAIRLDNSGQA